MAAVMEGARAEAWRTERYKANEFQAVVIPHAIRRTSENLRDTACCKPSVTDYLVGMSNRTPVIASAAFFLGIVVGAFCEGFAERDSERLQVELARYKKLIATYEAERAEVREVMRGK